jgi:hypothetical protein
MAKALLITTTDIKRYSVLNGNIDNDKFIQYIEIAQDTHLQNYLGTDLLEKIQSLLPTDIDDVANASYKTLLNTFVKPMLIHWSLVELLPFMAYTVANGGVYKHSAENSTPVDKNEVDYLVEKERNIAENYTQRFIDFMRYNQTDYPEYISNTDDDIRPDKSASFGGLYLGDSNSSYGDCCSEKDFWGIDL